MTDVHQAARDTVRKLPGLKEDELARLGSCVICKLPLLHQLTGGVTFYRLKIDRAMFDSQALGRRVGLGMVLGGSDALARVMGPDEPLARIFQSCEVVVHEGCGHHLQSVLYLFPDEQF